MGNIESLLPGGFDTESQEIELNDETEPAQGYQPSSQFDRDPQDIENPKRLELLSNMVNIPWEIFTNTQSSIMVLQLGLWGW
jgi:hypothetical protein